MATINKISTNCSQKLRMRSVNALLKIFVRPVMGGGLNPHQPPPLNTPLVKFKRKTGEDYKLPLKKTAYSIVMQE